MENEVVLESPLETKLSSSISSSDLPLGPDGRKQSSISDLDDVPIPEPPEVILNDVEAGDTAVAKLESPKAEKKSRWGGLGNLLSPRKKAAAVAVAEIEEAKDATPIEIVGEGNQAYSSSVACQQVIPQNEIHEASLIQHEATDRGSVDNDIPGVIEAVPPHSVTSSSISTIAPIETADPNYAHKNLASSELSIIVEKKICGLPEKTFWAIFWGIMVVAILVVIIVVTVVVGGDDDKSRRRLLRGG